MSKIEVNTIEPQCGTTLTVGAAGTNVTVPSNVVKSNALQASDAGNIIKQCGTTVTLGATGDTIALASGASQTGFGRTGTVDWITTPKTTTFTAVSGEGYFCNTTAAILTVNLPAGAAGSIVSLADYAATWQTNNVTVSPNGADKIGALNENAILSTEGQSVTFVYVDSTQGWVNTMDSTSNVRGVSPYIVATGGTPCSGAIVCTNYKEHTFTGPGTFCVSQVGTPAGSDTVSYVVAAGGGGGGTHIGGAGGAGGFREGYVPGSYTASPLAAACSSLPVSVQGYPITIGGGGAGGIYSPRVQGVDGSNSIFSSITSTGGGHAASGPAAPSGGAAGTGGSGGGGSGYYPHPGNAGGAGDTPPTTPAQGFPGGVGGTSPDTSWQSGGGGGATVIGASASGPNPTGQSGAGGAGATTSITASPVAYAGGGGGSSHACGSSAAGGAGGGGAGGCGYSPPAATSGTANLGGGGGGGGICQTGGAGGSGVVIIRYKFQ